MNQAFALSNNVRTESYVDWQNEDLVRYIEKSWEIVAPFWPLKNLIAVNPLQGFESHSFEEALMEARALFQQKEIIPELEAVNRETIKWCQAFFDDGQATLAMPLRHRGLYAAWKELVQWDDRLHKGNSSLIRFIKELPESPVSAINACLERLQIPAKDIRRFFEILLVTLPGWASHIKYRTDWNHEETDEKFPVSKADYLAIRIIIVTLLWPEARRAPGLFEKLNSGMLWKDSSLSRIADAETSYRAELIGKLKVAREFSTREVMRPEAQVIFCIDVRSEPFRRSLELIGAYETFGFAGFFGTPIRIEEEVTGKSYASCPVLLTTKHTIAEKHCCPGHIKEEIRQGHLFRKQIKRVSQSLKNTFTTPFIAVEMLGLAAVASMTLRTLFPLSSMRLKWKVSGSRKGDALLKPDLSTMKLEDQCVYAEGALRMIGLTRNFSEVVVFCGHGSHTENNAYATALDCGACGGHPGGSNARVLAAILNSQSVREVLRLRGILIPQYTRFLAAEHQTTTDEVIIFDHGENDVHVKEIVEQLKEDLSIACEHTCALRNGSLVRFSKMASNYQSALTRSFDWAETRPEWGLAKNGSFIVGPRSLTKGINLEGRSFLHSYEHSEDPDGAILTTILTAPMVVAHWINSQYLFSSIDNVAFGSGSKVTQNITGKLGIMQGNGSDLMSGLPIQSVASADDELYHEPVRLLTVVYAPWQRIEKIISEQEGLRKLFGNGWVSMVCIDPGSGDFLQLRRDLSWECIIRGGEFK